jgi:hypothetical protein
MQQKITSVTKSINPPPSANHFNHLDQFTVMGTGGSKPCKSPAEREADRRKRELAAQAQRKNKQERKSKKEAIKRERDAWLRNYRGRLEKKWWHAGLWPIYKWWKEKAAWEEELYRRRKEGLLDSEGVPLRSHYD